jgi:hypothetical protein
MRSKSNTTFPKSRMTDAQQAESLRQRLAERLGRTPRRLWRFSYDETNEHYAMGFLSKFEAEQFAEQHEASWSDEPPKTQPPEQYDDWAHLEDLPALVAEAERGLSEEQLGEYARHICANHLEADPLFYVSCDSKWDTRAFWKDTGLLITASPEARAAALCEILPCHTKSTTTQE